MHLEALSTLVLLVAAWIALALLDLFASWVLSLASGMVFRRAFLWGLLSLAIPVLVIAFGLLIGRNFYQVKRVELTFEDLPATFDGYRIAQISDIHSRSFLSRTRVLQKGVDLVNAQGADLIVFTGDIITLTDDELEVTGPVLKTLSAPDGVISILGNHDYGTYAGAGRGRSMTKECSEEVAASEKAMGWAVLRDGSRLIRRGNDAIAVVGVELISPSKHFFSRGDLKKASEGTDGLFRILLSHDPMHWDMDVVGKDYPLMLSGHTHAMQFSLFGWCPSKYMFEHYRGLYEKGMQKLYVNIGLGETIVPLRIGTRPEVTVITLKRKN